MSTHNIVFCEEMMKLIFGISLITIFAPLSDQGAENW